MTAPDHQTVDRRENSRHCHAVAYGLLSTVAFSWVADARGSSLDLTREAIGVLVQTALFKEQGKWYIQRGPCYAFLERPKISLVNGRLSLDAHYSSRAGFAVGSRCIGPGFASDVQLSGRFVSAGSRLTLSDVRIDRIDDGWTRRAFDLLKAVSGASLPRAVDIDVLSAVKTYTIANTGIRVDVAGLTLTSVQTNSDGITVSFDMQLVAH